MTTDDLLREIANQNKQIIEQNKMLIAMISLSLPTNDKVAEFAAGIKISCAPRKRKGTVAKNSGGAK